MTEVCDAEIRLAAAGLDLVESAVTFADRPADVNVALVLDFPRMAVHMLIRPGISPEVRALIAEWAERVLERFRDHGAEPDGWQARSDGGRQLWGRLVTLPQEFVDL